MPKEEVDTSATGNLFWIAWMSHVCASLSLPKCELCVGMDGIRMLLLGKKRSIKTNWMLISSCLHCSMCAILSHHALPPPPELHTPLVWGRLEITSGGGSVSVLVNTHASYLMLNQVWENSFTVCSCPLECVSSHFNQAIVINEVRFGILCLHAVIDPPPRSQTIQRRKNTAQAKLLDSFSTCELEVDMLTMIIACCTCTFIVFLQIGLVSSESLTF